MLIIIVMTPEIELPAIAQSQADSRSPSPGEIPGKVVVCRGRSCLGQFCPKLTS
ncbi:MAG: hypothetical protein RLZZ04_2086 [Cyanobacteriota bacterium]